MKVIRKVAELKQELQSMNQNKMIAFVPTMGYLHNGHVSLLEQAQKDNDVVVLSIFINPTQFNQDSDFQQYPKNEQNDLLIANQLGIDYVFLPTELELYPNGHNLIISENIISQSMEGRYRPNHFEGVLTILLKLFNIIKPNCVYFGEKDYQQYLVVKSMIKELFLDIAIRACPTVRCQNGVALSSRNSRLSPWQYQLATKFAQILQTAENDEQSYQKLDNLGIKIDYIESHKGRRYGAVWIDQVRLIDNVLLE